MILTNEEAIRIPCEFVEEKEIYELTKLLEQELEHSALLGRPGIGLAAPQLGIGKHIAIVRISLDESITLINSKIIKGEKKQMFRNEGCLSFPSQVENTMRYQEIVFSHDNQKKKAKGLFAVAIQHELDHLNQILLPDRAIKIEKSMEPNELCFCGSGKKFKKCHR